MLKAYEKYQEMGLPWLEQVPAHWGFLRNKNIFIEKKDVVGNSREYKLLSLTKKGIIIRDISTGKGKFPKDFESYKIVEEGDIVFCLFDVDETPRTVGLSNHSGMITGAYNVFNVRDTNSEFIQYYYIAFDNIKAFKPLYTGLRKVIQLSTFMSIKVPVPPRLEQEQIIHYLNWKVSEMNRFINQKKKQIKLLQELRITMINDAVTKGLNLNVKYKKSGHAWIENIPEHWGMLYSKKMFALRRDKAHPEDEQLTSSQKYGIIPQKEFMDCENRRVTVVMTGDNILKHVETGDFVISMRSFQGGIEYSRISGKISSAYVMLIPNHDLVDDRYFKWLLKSESYIKALQGTSDLVRDGQALRYTNFAKVYLPQVPLAEQSKIADFLDQFCPKIDEMIYAIKKEITYVKELRTKTIADVVTGKIDVRDVTVPDYIAEEEILEEFDIEATDEGRLMINAK